MSKRLLLLSIIFFGIALASGCIFFFLKQNESIVSTTNSFTSTLPIFSLTTDPKNLWSEEKGIYILGKNASTNYPYKGANYWKDVKVPVDINYLEQGKYLFTESAKLAIFGGETRTLPQKSFALYGEFNYPLFKNKQIYVYKNFVLRNSGQDFAKTHLLDGFVSTLVQETNIDVQAYRPVTVFLNDDYFGIYDLREKIDRNFLMANHDVNKKDIDLLESDALEKEGSNEDYLQLIQFIKQHNLSNEKNYDYVTKQIDIENLTDYIITELYIANTDWPSHNIRFWKAKEPFNKWRWIIYDSDVSFNNYKENTIARLLAYKGDGDDSLYISFLFRELIKNATFQNYFQRRTNYHLTHTFAQNNVIEVIRKLKKEIEPEMPRHLAKWGGTMAEWEKNVEKLEEFAKKRPLYFKNYLQEMYGTLERP